MGNMACILKDYTKDYYEKTHTHSVKVLSMFSLHFFFYNKYRINEHASIPLSSTLFYYENIVTRPRLFHCLAPKICRRYGRFYSSLILLSVGCGFKKSLV